MTRLLYFSNAFLCTVNVYFWFAIDGKFATLVVVAAVIAAAASLFIGFKTRDPYYFGG